MKKSNAPRGIVVAAVTAAVALTASACSSGGSDGGSAEKKDIEVVVISGPLNDPFFSAMSAGAEQAGKDLGIKVDYTAPKDLNNLGPDLSRLGDSALASKPDAVVASEFLADAQDAGLKEIADSGIPVAYVNAGPNWEKLGGFTYIGEDPALFGQRAGEQLAKDGAKNVLCVNHVPGNPTLEQRCEGVTEALDEAGGETTVLTIPADQSTNPTSVTNAISGALRSDDAIDGVLTLGSGVAENAVRAIESADSDAILGTGDLSKNVLKFIKDGSISFAVDQQPYLQGYYAVLAASQKVELGLQPVGQIKTAPLFVTKDTVDQVITLNDNNNGVRGAA